MDYSLMALLCVAFYIFTGFGFALASWLQAAELASDAGLDWSECWRTQIFFIVIWPIIAVYCYRAEVKKSIPKVDISKVGKG